MSNEVLTQVVTGMFIIGSSVISALLTYCFNQKSERKKRRFKKIDELKLWISNLSIVGFMQSVEYYEVRYLMDNQEKQQLDSQITIISSRYEEFHAELDADFHEWKRIWDMTLVTGSPSKIEPVAYYATMKDLMHKRYMLETQKNLAGLKEIMIAALCRRENTL